MMTLVIVLEVGMLVAIGIIVVSEIDVVYQTPRCQVVIEQDDI